MFSLVVTGSTPVGTAGRSLSRTPSPPRGSSSPGAGTKRKRTHCLSTPGRSPSTTHQRTMSQSASESDSQKSSTDSQKSSTDSSQTSPTSSSQTSSSESSGASGQEQKKKKKKRKKKRDSRRMSSESSDEETRPGSTSHHHQTPPRGLSPSPTRDSVDRTMTEDKWDPPPPPPAPGHEAASPPPPPPAPGHEAASPPPPPPVSPVSPDPHTGAIKPALGLPYTTAASPSSSQTTPETSPDLSKLTSESDTEMGEAHRERLRISHKKSSGSAPPVAETVPTTRTTPSR